PLFALRECFFGTHPFPPTPENVLGILSLIFWSLIAVISCKYLYFVMRADNRGEGGILALLALLIPREDTSRGKRRFLLWLGLFGAALLYGDGVITPAISILSAVEGLKVATPSLERYVVPCTVLIVVLLFLFQKRGTARVGMLFGPVMIVWFVTIATLGVSGILKAPQVLAAVNPAHAVIFFKKYLWSGFFVLGGVFLSVAGGEALYADMGHFGRGPIRFAWFSLVFPALLLNYFGQGALILSNPNETGQPFYHLAPEGTLYPLVFLATLATIIASQAIITGAFSLTRQAMQLGVTPPMRIIHTSSEEIGQIYMPAVNWLMMITTVLVVASFRSSGNLSAAYGVAIATTMLITTILAFFVTRERWKWSFMTAGLVAALLFVMDVSFFGANILKFAYGGWFPIVAGVAIFTLMITWRRGVELMNRELRQVIKPLGDFLQGISLEPPVRVPGTAVFIVRRLNGTPPMLIHHFSHNKALHDQVVLLNVVTETVPRIPAGERIEVTPLEQGFFRVIVRYGFMQSPNVPVALRECKQYYLQIDTDNVTYYMARETLIPSKRRIGMILWRDKLYSFMVRNALHASAFYKIPPEQIVEIGIQVEI
ncbi:MAG: potassium uptake protein, Kup system, partial [Deltaproteobacteria bacterium]|nr:potassium uptake protein, Kup system [Deltaproteobacteria bacterium]